jgi:hypothetical protein
MILVKRFSKPVSILILLAAYIAAMGGAMLVFILCPTYFSPVLSSVLASIGATMVIYLFSM